ncbi:MAG: hypothetical protein ACNS60_00800 [Candidatus Cyclobacteriaceae bacterium M2_1C_046]
MRSVINFLILALIVTACLESEYSRLVKSELANEGRKDSLLLDIYFGDSRPVFFQKCYQLNQKMLVSQGPSNSAVQYVFYDSLFHSKPTPVRLLFYPKFDSNGLINRMDLEFSYSGWAPYNKKLQSDALKNKVLDMVMLWYGGNSFITASINDNEVPVKVDSNRRMIVYIKDSQTVTISIQDILHPDYKHSITRQ